MSSRNGDKARFHKNRQRKLAKRQRVQALVAGARTATPTTTPTSTPTTAPAAKS
jgi:hypothetical protein